MYDEEEVTREQLVAQALHGIVVLGDTVIATALGIAGLVREYRSYAVINAGETVLALWMTGMGFVFIVAAMALVRDKLGG